MKGTDERLFEIFTYLVKGQYVGNENLSKIFSRNFLKALVVREETMIYFEEKISDGNLDIVCEFNIRNMINKVNLVQNDEFIEWLKIQFERLEFEDDKSVNTSIWNMYDAEWQTYKEAIINCLLPMAS